MQGGFTNHVSVLSAQNAEQTELYVCRNTNTLINQCGLWTFHELRRSAVWSLNSVPVHSIFAGKFCWTRMDDLGLLCRKAYSLITIDMQQTRRACFGCFVKTPACWRKLWWSVWWIEIHKMCFETEKSWVSLKSSRNLVNWSIGIQQTFGLSDKTSLYFFFVLSLL